MKLSILSGMSWTLMVSGLLLLAGSGTSFAIAAVPELDAGSAASGIALVAGAAVLMAERYRRRR
jgi:hypothetical protein